ncbi:uncharacterized protein LOC116849834 [Odontomachus brunneus]|uniref:uncharacterized protein LOC116849834 n=1 Tax=Odontomachus brunneus TaxID=486640 RepID=UPI0013F18D12|nr:uncharacterized protein LOC116849834 [Odontomachus brunneus]
MLRNIVRNIVPRNKSILFKRYNVPQAVLNVRHKQNMTTEIDDDLEGTRPVVYSKSKAAHMAVDEYRIPQRDMPSYQPAAVMISLIVFLVYFCILREENDIDEMMYVDLGTSLKRCETEHNKKIASK